MNLIKEDYDNGFCPIIIYDIPVDLTLNDLFKVNIDTSQLTCFTDAAT